MRLTQPLVKLPVRFCAETLAAEAGALPPSAWVAHPTGYEGNDAALLITPGGRMEQGFLGEMAPTEHLARTPYIRQIMATLGSTWGRSRLMRLAPGAQVSPHIAPGSARAAIQRPVFLLSTPRSGSTLLFQTLIQSLDACSIGNESHGLIEGSPPLHPAAHGWHSNRLDAADASDDVVEELSRRFVAALVDHDGARPAPRQRLIEKTPKNALRVPFLAAAYPDAAFVYLHRAARPTLSSMIEAWQSGRFRTYPRLPGWTGLPWSMLLVPGWRELAGRPLPEIAARQWAATTDILLGDLERLPPERLCALSYEAFLAAPEETMRRLCARLGLAWDRSLDSALPLSRTTVTAPDPEKWRLHEAEIEAVWPLVEAADARARAFAHAHAV